MRRGYPTTIYVYLSDSRASDVFGRKLGMQLDHKLSKSRYPDGPGIALCCPLTDLSKTSVISRRSIIGSVSIGGVDAMLRRLDAGAVALEANKIEGVLLLYGHKNHTSSRPACL